MKSLYLALAFALAAGIAFAQIKPNRQAGDYIAAAYNYDIDSVSGSGLGGPYTFTQAACTQALPFANSRNLNPFNTNASVLVQDTTQANTETVAFISLSTSSGYCVLQLAVTKPHISYHIRSGTFGLQEAINDATATGGGNVVVDTQWGGTTAMITNAAGNSNVSVSDNRTGTVLYVWNGSNYVPGGGGGGGGTPGGSPNQIQANLSGAFGGLPFGNLGQVLTSNGNGALATFQPVSPGNLPSQLGATPGSVLNTNGTAASWQAKPVCDTRDVAGADLGARINACTAQIGFTTTTIPGGFVAKYIGNPGTIRVDTADAGAISTQVIIPSNQQLSLGNGHYTNNFGEFIPPITLSDNSALACDSWATQIDNTSQNIGENIVVGMTNTLVCSSPAPPPCGAGGCEANCSFPPTVGVVVQGCHFKQSSTGSASGSSLTGTISLAQCQGCKALNNWFDGIGTTAVTLVGTYTQFSTHPEWSYIFGHDDEIAGNLITGVSNAGISVINNENVNIHDNFFRDHGIGAAAYVDLESNSVLDHMQYIDIHSNRFDCSNAPAGAAQCYGVTLQSVGPSVGHLKLHDNLLNGPLVAPGGYLVGGIGSVDFNAHGNNEVEIYNNQLSYTTTSPIAIAGGDNSSVHDNLLTCDQGGIQISPGVTGSTIASNVFSSPPLTSFVITSVATTADNLVTVYTGTFTGGGSNGLANQTFTIAGFSNAVNNGTFGATASTATTLTLTNTAGASETHAATATTGCTSGLTGAQNFTKIFETDSTDDYNVFRDNVGAGQTITFGAHSRIIDTKAANLQTDAASQTFNIPTGFGSVIPGGIATSAITAPVLNGTGPTNVAVCTGVLTSATYDYIVTAVAANGAEAPSNEIAKSITVGQCALLGWTYAAGAASYNIYRGTASGNELLMANVLQGTLGYADPGGQTPGVAVPVSNTTGGVQVSNLTALLPVCTDGSKQLSNGSCASASATFARLTLNSLGSWAQQMNGGTSGYATQTVPAVISPYIYEMPSMGGNGALRMDFDASNGKYKLSTVADPPITPAIVTVINCGSVVACANAGQHSPIFAYGHVPLTSASPSTASVTTLPYSSATSYVCTASPAGTTAAIAAGGVAVNQTSGSAMTLTGPNTVTTVINFNCSGN